MNLILHTGQWSTVVSTVIIASKSSKPPERHPRLHRRRQEIPSRDKAIRRRHPHRRSLGSRQLPRKFHALFTDLG